MKSNRVCIIIAVFVIAVGLIVTGIIMHNSTADNTQHITDDDTLIMAEDEVSEAVSDILKGRSLDPTASFKEGEGENEYEDEYVKRFKECDLPFETRKDIDALSVEEIDESIAHLQAEYLYFIENCKYQYFKEWAEQIYNFQIEMLYLARDLKTITPERRNARNEQTFYNVYQLIVDECTNSGTTTVSPNDASRLDVAERAKKYYENGTITIDQACQALGIADSYINYDENFVLPE